MASSLPNIPGTGSRIAVSKYAAGITEFFPNVNKKRIVETAINSRERIDIMPTGLSSLSNDKHIEFRIKGSEGVLLDMSSLSIELQVTFEKDGGFKDDDEPFTIVNGFSNTLFKSVNVFLNEKIVESNPMYNYTSYIKMLQTFPISTLTSLGACGHLKDDHSSHLNGIPDQYTSAQIKLMEGDKALITKGVELHFPLLLDLAGMDMYLLDGIDLRVRLELANRNWFMGYRGVHAIRTNIRKMVLWIDRVVPVFNAMKALSDSLKSNHLEYKFNKCLLKTYIVGANENNIVIDQPFNNVIPDKLSLCFIANEAFNGSLTRNPLFFPQLDVSQMRVSINGNTAYALNNDITAYYETLRSLGLQDDHMITRDAFFNGRCVYNFNFVPEDIKSGNIPIETSANMRISIDFNTPPTVPHILLLIGDSIGIMNIDKDRHIQCEYRA